jgi:hypothetical protein
MESEEDGNVHNFDRHLVVVEYPGVVLNVDRAIRTLGGLQNISTVSNNNWKLHVLSFKLVGCLF